MYYMVSTVHKLLHILSVVALIQFRNAMVDLCMLQ